MSEAARKRAQRAEERRRQMAEMDEAIAALDIDITGSARGMTSTVMPSTPSGSTDASASGRSLGGAGASPAPPSRAVEHARNFLWDDEGMDMPLGQPVPSLVLVVTGEGRTPSAQNTTGLISASASGSSRDIIDALQKSMDELDPSFAPVLVPGGPNDGMMGEYGVGSDLPSYSRGSIPGYRASVYGSNCQSDDSRGVRGVFWRLTTALGDLSAEITESLRNLSAGSSGSVVIDYGSRNIAPRRMSGDSMGSNPMDYSDAVKRLTARAPRRGRRTDRRGGGSQRDFSYGINSAYDDDNDNWWARFCYLGEGCVCSRVTRRMLLTMTSIVLFGLAIALIVVQAKSSATGGARSSVGSSPPKQPTQPVLEPTAPRPPPLQDFTKSPLPLDEKPTPTGDTFNGISVIHPDVPENSDAADRMGLIYQLIVQSGLSLASDVDDESSPQHKALVWISSIDAAQIDPKDRGVLQRYSLAVLFFSTFASEDDLDVEHISAFLSKHVAALGDGWKDRTNWLTSKGHCSWAGVQCHHRDGTPLDNTVYDGNEGVTVLNLTANNLDGTVPREIKGLGDLRILDLGDNLIQGTLPSSLGRLEALQMLYLDGNGIEGALPRSLGNLFEATHIDLSKNYIDGQIPVELSDLTKLRTLSLYQNSLTGTLPDLFGLSALQNLYLDSNYMTGEIPESLADLSELNDLRLGNNEFTGPVPDKLCELDSLATLYLEENFLDGSIMDCVGNMKSLAEFQLYGNRISGSIPDAIGDLSSLEVLYIDDNELEGPLPSSLGKLENLVSVYAQNNLLTGQIPQELSALTNLQRLYLHENKLQGQVPAQLGALKSLQKVRLHGNDLSGQVPVEICMLKDHSLVDLQGDCAVGKLECECCTQCH